MSNKSISFEDFQDLCRVDLEGGDPAMTPGADECAAQLFIDEESPFESSGILAELINTGSVTVVVGQRTFILSLDVEEAV